MADMADAIADCSGISWSELATKLDLKSFDCEDVIATTNEASKAETDSMKLKKEEMTLYGLCPAQDEFFLVICECCHLLIKPQALQYHMDVRHKNYSNSQAHNCALPLCAIEPITARNPKCSSNKTNSSVSAKSTKSLPGQPAPTSNHAKGRPPKTKGRPPVSRGPAKNSEQLALPNEVISSKISESNDKCRGNPNVLKMPLVTISTSSPNVSSVKHEQSLRESVQSNSCKMMVVASAREAEVKDFDEAIVFEPTQLKISEEEEALVKLLESNTWRDVDVKQEIKDEINPDDTSYQACDTKYFPNDIKPVLVTIVKTTTLTTTTCSMSKSTAASLVTTSGIGPITTLKGSGSDVKSSSVFRCNSLPTTATSVAVSVAKSHAPTVQTLGTTELASMLAVKTADEVVRGSINLEKKGTQNSQTVTQGSLKVDVSMARDASNSSSLSNVISKGQLKPGKGNQKSPSKFLLCKDREFDPNKHCGVWIEEIHKQCTRSLTCKSHSLSLRRGVQGRSKLFDQLLSEQREKKLLSKDKLVKGVTKLKEKGVAGVEGDSVTLTNNCAAKVIGVASSSESLLASSLGAANSEPQLTQVVGLLQHGDKLKKSSVISNLSRPLKPCLSREDAVLVSSSSAADEVVPAGDREETISADKSKPESSSYGHCNLSHHPHPIAVNGFNSYLYGRGCYVFNRKEDLVRAALVAAFEKHVQPQTHKKLCLDSNFPSAHINVTPNDKVLYEFLTPDGVNVRTNSTLASSLSQNKLQTKPGNSAVQSVRKLGTAPSTASLLSASVAVKRPAVDVLENKRKISKTDSTSSNEILHRVTTVMPSTAPTESINVIASGLAAAEETVRLVLPARVDTTSLQNGQLVGIPITASVASSLTQRRQSSELRLSRPPPPRINKVATRTMPIIAATVPNAVHLSAKFVSEHNFVPNSNIKLETRPTTELTRLSGEFSVPPSPSSVISDSGRHVVTNEYVAIGGKTLSCISGQAPNSLLKPTASVITANRIPNIVLTSTVANGAVKLATRNAAVKGVTSSTNQTNLAAILSLNHTTNAKLAPLSDSQVFVASNIPAIGKTSHLTVSHTSDASKQSDLLPANSSAALHVRAALTSPTSSATVRSGFSGPASSVGSIAVGNRHFILGSGGVRHGYTAPISTAPKKPLTTGRVQVHQSDIALPGKTAPSTPAFITGSKFHLSGQPI